MRGTLRRLFIALIILAALVALAYHSRHKIHLTDFTWKKFVVSLGDANIWLLLLALVSIYGCYAIRALRWQRFCRYVGPTSFRNTYAGTLMGFAAIFVLGRAGEPVRPLLLARKAGLDPAQVFKLIQAGAGEGKRGQEECSTAIVHPSNMSGFARKLASKKANDPLATVDTNSWLDARQAASSSRNWKSNPPRKQLKR